MGIRTVGGLRHIKCTGCFRHRQTQNPDETDWTCTLCSPIPGVPRNSAAEHVMLCDATRDAMEQEVARGPRFGG